MIMFGENYNWNYDYVGLACDSGFSFQRYPSQSFDKNKISSIDVDQIIQEKDVASVEKFITCVCQFVLDPDQAKILDDNFVKVFRLSQLIIDYLLFCKKYLDKSLNEVKEEIHKVRKENKELNLFVDDLQEHVSVLMKEIKEQNAAKSLFTCEHCKKKFSTEEFLNSHLKRRHLVPPIDLETDKLHMEIKELKGRLNSTEKLIQQEQNHLHEVESDHRINELKKVDELQQKFEDLRVQVQSELKVLQTQYNFQEKYEKLFEKMTFQNLQVNKSEARILERRRESTTQTEKESVSEKVEVKKNTQQQQITELKEALEVKVSTSLEKIESLMQCFSNKLHEMEIPKTVENPEPPPVKPRSKYTIKDTSDEPVDNVFTKSEDHEEPDRIVQMEHQSPDEEEEESSIREEEKKCSESETESIVQLSEVEEVVKKPSIVVAKKRSSRKSVAKKVEVDEEVFEHFKDEVENIMVVGRLMDLGVSPEWKGIPTSSFEKALEIVNHKANLMKKTYPDFDKIFAQLEEEINRKAELLLKEKNLKSTGKKKIISVSKKNKFVEIHNRKMYETTDSESEPVKVNLNDLSLPYSAVIEELKTVTTKFEESDLNEETQKNEETKGVLKNYPSVGSLTKKKVLFNLYNNENYQKRTKEGESTTSITSSILDGSPKKRKDIEDLSDFDFSDV